MIKFLLSLLGLSYLISPWDCFPDFFVGIGWLDDLIVVGLLWWYLYVYRKRYPRGRSREPQHGPYDRNASSGEEEGRSSSGRDAAQSRTEKDPYTVLQLAPGATQQEIRDAYRILAGRYHPDKVTHLGEEFKELAEARFKEIQNAYETLKVK